MLQLNNSSPFAPAITVIPNKDGIDTLYVVVRGTFTLFPEVAIAPAQVPPVLADEYWGEPGESSLKYTSELHVGKPGTDVVLVGSAWARGGRAHEEMVTLTAAERRKSVHVFGDRTWSSGGRPSSPAPFESMPLVYERAFGGALRDPNDPSRVTAEERNPVGLGLRGPRGDGEMVGQRLPNLEDPAQLLASTGDTPPPACFAFVAPSWMPRRMYGGTYDQAWQKKRAPYLPADFQLRFFNAACPEMIFDRFLEGGEPITLVGASRQGPMRFALPRCWLRVDVKIAGRSETPPLNLETVLIEPDQNRLSISWRGALVCDKQALKVQEIAVALDPTNPLPGRGS
jgi:hypothetical protein